MGLQGYPERNIEGELLIEKEKERKLQNCLLQKIIYKPHIYKKKLFIKSRFVGKEELMKMKVLYDAKYCNALMKAVQFTSHR